jgi:hypothetical protein
MLLSFQATQAMTATTATPSSWLRMALFLVAVCALVSEGLAVNVVLYVNALLGVRLETLQAKEKGRQSPAQLIRSDSLLSGKKLRPRLTNWRNRLHRRAPQQRDRL